MKSWVVLKFGGTSVAGLERWKVIEEVVRRHRRNGSHVLVVHSALPTVSDHLSRLAAAPSAAVRASLLDEIENIHEALLDGLGIRPPPHYLDLLNSLRTEALDESDGEPGDPAASARIGAYGELLATSVGVARLRERGLAAEWFDARDALTTLPGATGPSTFLSAECSSDFDPSICDRLEAVGSLIVTQGYIGRTAEGHTALLGRGGSDTSAAYFAGKLDADRIEIWTDVPGIFSADPGVVPSALRLSRLDYREAQEIFTTGSSVLHPRCIPAVRDRRIPIHVRSTLDPSSAGTHISFGATSGVPKLKAISCKRNVTLVSMETVGMWQHVGFLAAVFDSFRACGLSVDLVSTSETSVSVSLDDSANPVESSVLHDLERRLAEHCTVRVVRGCAAVSLVGRKIRSLLHQIGPAFEVFQEQRVHMVSQAASDLNLTFVVDEEYADRLVSNLHDLLIVRPERSPVLESAASPASRNARDPESPTSWWALRREELLEIGRRGRAAYVYDLDTVRVNTRRLLALGSVGRLYYALKANPHPAILRTIGELGAGFECVSIEEVRHVLELLPEIDRDDLLFTPNFAPRSEYAEATEKPLYLTLDNLHPLRRWPELFEGTDLFLRLDPASGEGHHEKVRTAGRSSKFGISTSDWDELRSLLDQHSVSVRGLHAHTGSGILTPSSWRIRAEFLADALAYFPEAKILNLGGGLGVPEQRSGASLRLADLDRELTSFASSHPDLTLLLEPGRYLVANAGVLVAQVTQTKGKGDSTYVGINTGMNSLIRPALYGAIHEIVNLTRLDEPAIRRSTVVGPICESGDRLGIDRALPDCEEGDVLLVLTTGAYGRVMSSQYNMRAPAEEIVLP